MTIRRREDACPQWERPFLSLHRLRVVNTRADGTRSAEYDYDAVLRVQLDAVAVILTSGHPRRPSVLLRACLRPPLLLRAGIEAALPESPPSGILWELPAGLLELADRGASGILRRAAAETLEETGYRMPPEAFTLLPGAPFVTPGSLPERIHFARAHVDDIRLRERPSGDGSPVEEGPLLRWVSLDEALASCDAGEIDDMKTELGLRRLAGQARATGLEVSG
ncbi:MAG TPA: NUDIX domain-containing protein [Polyangia bacterium]|nr:NUDIX domain-containing protein [Polyangia bacterium]